MEGFSLELETKHHFLLYPSVRYEVKKDLVYILLGRILDLITPQKNQEVVINILDYLLIRPNIHVHKLAHLAPPIQIMLHKHIDQKEVLGDTILNIE